MEKYRLFFGVPLHDEAIDACFRFTESFNSESIRRIRNDNWHVTLLFIGDFPAEHIPGFCSFIHENNQNIPSFFLDFNKFTYFPERNPRMIWGLFKEHPAFTTLTKNLHHQTQSFCRTHHIPFEEALNARILPHITLSRLKDRKQTRLIFPDTSIQSIRLPVRNFHLYRSQLHSQGAEYTLIHTFVLV